ncbi:hypothetical protein HRI_004542200 [Hibiscus trionum]|uniref:CCHC-type domain-containing protein n=1 Tax=Hibiscus trionum TaxID=183268 RepID=A0A9W7J7E9_HIBTR|nr:hypothetical protein HRI_004542200 [Hibiscus trionum]
MPTAEDSANLTAEQVRELQITDDQDEGQFFANKQVNVKLDDYNFLLWKQQVILMIRGHDLEHFLDESTLVPAKVITNSSGQLAINPAYRRFRKQDSSLASWLLSTISPGTLPQLVGSETTAGIWSSVIKLYSKLSTTKIMSLHCKLRSMKKGTSTVSEYTTHIKEICDLLATTGNPVSEIEQIATILNGLLAEYEAFIAALTVSREPYTLESVTSAFKDAKSRLLDPLRVPIGINVTRFNPGNSSGKSYDIRSDNRDSRENLRSYNESRPRDQHGSTQFGGRFFGRPRIQCQMCGKLGHLADRCWYRFDKGFKGSITSPTMPSNENQGTVTQANVCQFVTDTSDTCYDHFVSCKTGHTAEAPLETEDTDQINSLIARGFLSTSDKWYPDSGATHHVTSEPPTGQNTQPYTGKGKVFLGDGSMLHISQVSQFFVSVHSRSLALNHVFTVPRITRNLMSVSRFAKDNLVFFEFHESCCFVKDERSKAILMEGRLEDGLYCFNMHSSSNSSATECHHTTSIVAVDSCDANNTVLKPSSHTTYWLWHQRLGHPAAKIVNLVLDKPVYVDKRMLCTAYQLGKSHKLPFSSSLTVYKTPFELVEADVWGPAPIKLLGWQYYVTFVDMYSRNCWLFLLRNKSEVSSAFKVFVALVKNQFSKSIIAL